MVRFHWHVEDGYSAFVPVQGSIVTNCGIQHMLVEMEVPGMCATVTGMLTMPANAHLAVTRSVGIILAHDNDATKWQSNLMNSLAQMLAQRGFLVMRNQCALTEPRRQRAFERALDVAATSPYARHITSWILAGVGIGSRVAAAVGTRCRGTISGYILLSYPLEDALPASKGPGATDSKLPITKSKGPILFVHTQSQKSCPVDALKEFCSTVLGVDFRLVVIPDVDPTFGDADAGATDATIAMVCKAVVRFARSVAAGTMDQSNLPPVHGDQLQLSDNESEEDLQEERDQLAASIKKIQDGGAQLSGLPPLTRTSQDTSGATQLRQLGPRSTLPGMLPPLPSDGQKCSQPASQCSGSESDEGGTRQIPVDEVNVDQQQPEQETGVQAMEATETLAPTAQS